MIRILLVGTGGMARAHAGAFQETDGATVVAAVDTNPDRLQAFIAERDIPRGFASVNDALDWGRFDAVCNVTPDAVHHQVAMPLLAAGKHMLCEKPLATNHADAIEMTRAAQEAGVINMVNLTYRNSPALIAAADMVARGKIGALRHFEASYLQSWLTQPLWGDWRTEDQWLWRLSTAHGSAGVLGDVGIHILDFTTFAAGADISDISCRLTTFPKADDDRIGDYFLDANDSAMMHVRLTNGATGVVHASRFASGHINDLRVRLFGTEGGIEVVHENGADRLRTCLGDDLKRAHWQNVAMPEVPTNYARFVTAIQTNTPVTPDFMRGAILQNVLDHAQLSDTKHATNQVLPS